MKTLRSAVVAATLALAVVEAGADGTPQERPISLAIESKTLAEALDKWAQQTGFQIFVPNWEMTKKIAAPKLHGKFGARDALDRLLEGTPLMGVWTTDKSVTIREKPTPIVWEINPSAPTVQKFVGDGFEGRQAAPSAAGTGNNYVTSSPVPRPTSELRWEGGLEEIVVTGTHIIGSQSAGSRVIRIDREAITKTGYATVEEVIRTLPQNFGGGVAQAQVPQLADEGAANFNEGTAINLRGLGADSTLVLIDGRRQPGSGLNGAFVDISSIPLSAVERIEVLPDGASAIYGSDAVGGVVNFVLRRDFKGAESQVRFGSARGGVEELHASQILGHSWSAGNVLLGYQYDDRDSLPRLERSYSASDDLRPFGGSDFRFFYSNPGNILDPNTFEPAAAIPRGQDGTSLEPSDLLPGVVNYDSSSQGADLFGSQEMHSAFLNASQRFGDQLELFTTGRFATRRTERTLPAQATALFVPSSNPFYVDPFGGSDFVFVAYNFSADIGPTISRGTVDTYSGTVGATGKFAGAWQLTASGTYGREDTLSETHNAVDMFSGVLDAALADPDPSTAFNPFADGSNTNASTLAAIHATSTDDVQADISNWNIVLNGPLFPLGGANAVLAIGMDYRDEEIDGEQSLANTRSERHLGRQVKAAFAELALPIVGPSNSSSGMRALNLSLAGRYEDYSDFGTTLNGKLGVTWAPTQSVALRATWGNSFKAPRLNQLLTTYPEAFDFFLPLPSQTGSVNSLVRFGNNADLKEETATTWTFGIEMSPAALPALSTSLTFWEVNYKDRVSPAGPTGNPLGVLFEADAWRDVITFNPTAAQVEAVCRSSTFSGNPNNTISVEDCLTLTPDAIVDLRLRNLALVRTRGVDIDARYRFETDAGDVTVGVAGVYVPTFERQITRAAQDDNLSNRTGNVLKLRLRASASWKYGGFDVSAFVNYANRYEDTFALSGRDIPAWTTVDGSVSYQFAESNGLLGGLSAALHALNILDSEPPFANVGYSNFAFGYDTTNASPFGRVLSLQLSKVWGSKTKN